MSEVKKVGDVSRGTVYDVNGTKVVVLMSMADGYGDRFYGAGIVALSSDFRPFTSWKEAYAYAERLADAGS